MVKRINYKNKDSKKQFTLGKHKMKIIGKFFSIFMLLSFSYGLCAKEIDRIAVIVNDKAITLEELNAKMMEAATAFGIKEKNKDKILKNQELKQKTINLMIREILVDEQIRKRNLEVTDAQLDMFIQNIMRQNRLTSIEGLKSALALQNLTFENYKKSLRDQIQKTKVMNYAARSRVNISDQDLKNYYSQNREEARDPDSVYLKNIFISSNSKNRDKKRSLAQKAFNSLKKGSKFEAVVKKYSEDSNAKTGGDLGFMTYKDLNPKIYSEVSKIKPGQYTKIIDTPAGFYILKLTEKKKGQIREFDEVKEELRNKLTEKETENKFNAWVDELKSGAFIDIKI